jgi:hypothetical protein
MKDVLKDIASGIGVGFAIGVAGVVVIVCVGAVLLVFAVYASQLLTLWIGHG